MAVQYGLASRASPLVARSSRTASLRKAATAPATATVKRSGGEGFKRLEVLAFRTEGDSGSSGGRSSSLVVPDLTSLMARSPGASKLQLEYGGGEGGGGKGPRGRGRRRDGGGGGWWGKGGGDEDDEDKIRQMPKQVSIFSLSTQDRPGARLQRGSTRWASACLHVTAILCALGPDRRAHAPPGPNVRDGLLLAGFEADCLGPVPCPVLHGHVRPAPVGE